MGQTLAEKLISAHAGYPVRADDLVVVRVDGAMASDTTAPLAIKAFRAMGGKRVVNPRRCFLVIDHAAPAPNERIANLHALMRTFAREQECVLFEAGEGICHQLLVEKGLVRPNEIIIGADSHTCTYGAVGAMGVGVGSTDLAGVLLTGKIWLRVPHTLRVQVAGRLRPGVMAKDLALALLRRTGVAGATYRALEWTGEAIAGLGLGERMTLANMAVETGAKTAFVDPCGLDLLGAAHDCLRADPDASYLETLTLQAGELEPLLSQPHSPERVVPVRECAGKRVDLAFIGTCTNGRLEDLRVAAALLRDARVAPQTRLLIAPASRQVFLDALREGLVASLTAAGATWIPPGCGPCVGTHNGIPGDGETVISTANRNFKGRMGNPAADIYLASPATVAASARAGHIVDPGSFADLLEAKP
ncbi:MAG: 3-isopropylmalate dehydratase large subunit [Desulfomicrobiaceae bacterium]|nr:3-isopropylmalate dehydratase large subunit [Desulfomicrobiaceae bacterium]